VVDRAVRAPGTCIVSGRGEDREGFIDTTFQRGDTHVYVGVTTIKNYARGLDMIDASAHEAALAEQAEQYQAEAAELVDFREGARRQFERLNEEIAKLRLEVGEALDAKRKAERTVAQFERERRQTNAVLDGLGLPKPKPTQGGSPSAPAAKPAAKPVRRTPAGQS
jgi:hypothetical protein